MPQRNMEALLLCHTPEPETAIALAGRLCYSDSDILSLKEAVQGKSESFVKKLISLGHLSPIEHASFTFAAQGVSRALLAQITRHRIASFSVQSQRYVKKDALDYIVPHSIKARKRSLNTLRRYGSANNSISIGFRSAFLRRMRASCCQTPRKREWYSQ